MIGQKYPVQYYTEASGLPSSHINSIIQDSVGNIWFASDAGLTKYDSYNFTNYDFLSELKTNEFRKLRVDKSGHVWAVSELGGIHVLNFNGTKWIIKSHPNLEHRTFTVTSFDVFINEIDTLIAVGTLGNGVEFYDGNSWNNISELSGLSTGQVHDVLYYGNKFFIAARNGLFTLDKQAVVEQANLREYSSSEVGSLETVGDTLFVLGRSFIGKFYNDNFLTFINNINLPVKFGDPYYSFIPDYYDRIIIASGISVQLLNRNGLFEKYITDRNGLISYGASDLLLDQEKNLWIASKRGVTKIPSMRFQIYKIDEGLLSNDVSSIIQQDEKRYILGHTNGITVLDDYGVKTFSFTEKAEEAIDYRVLDMEKLLNGDVLIAASSAGLATLSMKNKLTWDHKIPSAVSIMVTSGGTKYISTGNNILKRLPGESNYIAADIKSGDTFYLRKLFEGKNGEIVCACSNGLGVIKNNSSIQHIVASTPKANDIFSYYKDSLYTFVGTADGLYTVAGDSLIKFFENDFHIDHPVYFILHDKLNNYWFGTKTGVIRWNGDFYFDYNTGSGLPGLETNRDAGYIDSKGRIWFGTVNGVAVYDHTFDNIKDIQLNVTLDSIRSGTKTYYSFDDPIEIDYDDNTITFFFKLYSFINERNNSYEVKLDGFDSDWISINGQSRIRYTNLPPGTYNFSLRAINGIGIKSERFVGAEIKILKPIYLQLWFWLAAFLGLGLTLYWLYFVIVRTRYSYILEGQVRQKERAIAAQEYRYKQIFHDNRAIMLIIDPNNQTIIDANKAALNYYGYSADEFLGKSISEIDTARVEPYTKPDLELQNINFSKHKLANGEIRDVEIYGSIVESDEKTVHYAIVHDITERKKAETRLRQLSLAVEQSPISVVITNVHGDIIYVNPRFTEITGYSLEEMKGKNPRILKSDKANTVNYKELWDTISNGKIWRGEFHNKKKNGELYWASAIISPVLDDRNKIDHFIAVEEDITFQKYAIEEIKKNEQLLNTILFRVPVMIFALDTKGKIVLAKGKVLNELGVAENMVIGKSVFDLFRRAPEIIFDIKKALSGKTLSSVRKLLRRVYEATYSPIGEGTRLTGVLGVVYDITERYNSEIAIKESEAKLRGLFDAIPDQMLEISSTGQILNCHNVVTTILNLKPEEIIGKKIKNILPENLSIAFTRAINEALQTKDIIVFEYEVKDGKDKGHYEFRLISTQQKKILSIVRDISERIEYERNLIKSKEEAEKTSRLKTEFLAQMSHEIRTPINSILSFSSLLRDEVADKIPEELQEAFNVIDEGGRRLTRTIDLILNMSQLQTGNFEPNYKVVDIDKEILKPVVDEMKVSATSKGLKLTYFNDADDTFVVADDYTLSQIFINLIDNAIKYTSRGSVNVITKNVDEKIAITVQDTGIGISKEYLPNLFHAFTQETTGYTRKFEGNGLGLALVKNYVEINNGEIIVESEKGKGAKFIVYFNLAR